MIQLAHNQTNASVLFCNHPWNCVSRAKMNGTLSNVCFAFTRSALDAGYSQQRISRKDIWRIKLRTSVWLAVNGSSLKKIKLCVQSQPKNAHEWKDAKGSVDKTNPAPIHSHGIQFTPARVRLGVVRSRKTLAEP